VKARLAAPLIITGLLGFVIARGAPEKQPYSTWSDYGGSADSMQYSALKQIDRTNVNQLELAWSYPVPPTGGRFGFNPVIVPPGFDLYRNVVGPDRARLRQGHWKGALGKGAHRESRGDTVGV
jgi:hypothetical protein